MTHEEIIQSLRFLRLRNNELNIKNDVADKIIEALEKQIPKKPKPLYGYIAVNHLIGKCDTCDNIMTNAPKYCEDCGQAILWGE